MKSLTRGKMWCYAIGQLGWSIISGLIGSWLVYFYQPNQEAINEGMISFIPQGRVVLGLLTIIGLITAIGRVFDAVTDPLVGNWSDKCRNKRGRRIPFLRWSAIPLGLVFLLVFCVPTNGVSTINTVWLFIAVLAYYFLITCYCTPYTSLLAELPHNQEEKLKLSMCISLTFIVGTCIGYTAPIIWGILINGGIARIPAMRITFAILSALATISCLSLPLELMKKITTTPSLQVQTCFLLLAKPSKTRISESLLVRILFTFLDLQCSRQAFLSL